MGDRIKVQATKLGYYDHARRREGDVFYINGKKDKNGNVIAFSEKWMVRVGQDKKTPPTHEDCTKETEGGCNGPCCAIESGKPLVKMNKSELLAKAKELNLEVAEDATNAVIKEAIENAIGAN